MNDKTAQLRDIFMDVADEETVTETQQEGHGSLATDDGSVDDRLRSVIERLRGKFDLQTELDVDRLCRLVREFYGGADDEEIAATLDTTERAVFRARMDLHLVRDAELPGPALEAAIRDADDAATDRLAAEFDVPTERVEQASAAVAALRRSRRVSQQFRTQFEEALTDADLAVQFTADAHEDGLEEATEGAEVDVEL